MDPALVAEDLMGYLPLASGGVLHVAPWARFAFQPGPHPYFASVSGVRATAPAEALLDEATAWFADHGRTEISWWLGPHALPTGLVRELLALGAAEDEPGAAMVLRGEPPRVPEVEVRQVLTREDLAAFRAIVFEVDDTSSDEHQAAVADGLEDSLALLLASGSRRAMFLAYDDEGTPVSAGALQFSEQGLGALCGGATRPWARGAGLYRALVRRRWEHAREQGSSTLVTQASPMSRPVLERLGFEVVADLTVLRTGS